MSRHDILAAQFARCVELVRHPAAAEKLQVELRRLVDFLRDEPFVLKDEGHVLSVNGALVGGPVLGPLTHRLGLHGVAQIHIPQDPPASEVTALVRGLGEQPGDDDLPSQLRAAGVSRVTVTVIRPSRAAPPPAPSVAELGTAGILRGDPMTDIVSSEPVEGVPALTYDPLPPDSALPVTGTAIPAAALPEPPMPLAAAVPGAPPPKKPVTPEEALEAITRNPESPNLSEILALLGRMVERAVTGGQVEKALAVTGLIVRQEQKVEDASAKRQYGIALRRLYSKSLLKALAPLIGVPAHREEAIAVMRRGGAESVEVLLDRLIGAPDIAQRRGAFDALRQMTEGTEQLIQMLGHHEWFVVRNVAELVGELGMESAVPQLGKLLVHEDERVRKAAALALAKVGSRNATDVVRKALRDKSAEVRVQVALGVGGRRSQGLAMPLVVALDEEQDELVKREMILALGRIATADAIQALIKCVQPSGKLFGKKRTPERLAAVEALRIAGTPAALGTLEGLSRDSDRQVRAAAEAAVQDIRKPKKG